MPAARTSLLAAALAAALAAPAAAAVPHTVAPGETLWGIAAANNFTTRSVAAFNGLPENANVIAGATIQLPSVAEASAALQNAGVAPAAPASSAAPAALGAYSVRPGDTLSGLAAIARVPMEQMAAMNGLDPSKPLLIGTILKLPSGAPTPPRADEPAPAPVVPDAAPNPTPTRVGAGDVQTVAAQHGVPASLAAAIGWQESGFNNAMVSSANARGIMQVMPGTWQWVQENLASRQLDPNSAHDNVHAGVLYLRRLLDATGGDENAAIAGYYQGLASVQSRGLFDDTKQYVANVQALRSRFGG